MSRKLTDKESRFIDAFLGEAAGNGAKAAVLAGYGKASAKVTASRLLKKEHIKLALVNKRADQVSQVLQTHQIIRERVMSGDEAIERLTTFARADIGQVLGPDDPISQLAPEVRACIKSVRPTRYGRVIELHDAMKATELMAKVGGKLKETIQVENLEQLIAKSMPTQSGAAA